MKPVLATARTPLRIACLGDSITEGMEIGDPLLTYPAQLQNLFQARAQVANFGKRGSTLLRLGDSPYFAQDRYLAALRFDPDFIVVALGTNDTKPENWQHHRDFRRDYIKLLGSIVAQAPSSRVFLSLPPPCFPNRFRIDGEILRREIHPLIRAVCRERDLDCIDLHAPLADLPKLFPDGVHPNAEGARAIAQCVFERLQQAVTAQGINFPA